MAGQPLALSSPACCRVQVFGESNAVTTIDKDNQTVTLACGRKIAYDALISTIPLDITLRWLGKDEWADGLTHSSSHIIGIGELHCMHLDTLAVAMENREAMGSF